MHVITAQNGRRGRVTLVNRQKRADALAGYAFLSPWLIGLAVFVVFPFLYSIIMAFTNTKFQFTLDWVGLKNFIRIFNDPVALKSIDVTIRFALATVPLRLFTALMVAVLLNSGIRGLGIYRTIYYIPSLIGSGVAVAIMWRRLFGSDGLFNNFIAIFGIQGQDWIANPGTARFMLVLLSAWQFGSSMLIFLAALKQVPKDLYASADIDGAGKTRQFLSITVPLISPVIFFNLIMQTITAFKVFTQARIITNGGPINETMFMVLNIYNQAFRFGNMSYAAALSWVLLIIIGILTGLNFILSKKWVYYETK